MTQALRSPLPVNDLPLKLATWTYKEPGTKRVRVLVSTEAERLASQSLTYTVGVAIVGKDGRGVSLPVDAKTLTAKRDDPGTAVFSGMIAVDPGEYRVIVSMADSDGKVGSVSRTVTAFQMDGPGVSLGDLMVSAADPGGAAVIEPAIEPHVTGPMSALMEAYAVDGSGLEAVLEIVTSENGAPLAAVPMSINPGRTPEIANASAQFNTSVLPPGRYLARGVVKKDGKPAGHLLRRFRIVEASSTEAAPSASLIPNDMAVLLLGALPNFDRKVLLSPAALAAAYTSADGRAGRVKGGDEGSALGRSRECRHDRAGRWRPGARHVPEGP